MKRKLCVIFIGLFLLPATLFAQPTRRHISLNYKFEGCPVQQTSYETCWAAGVAMMVAWKEGICPDIYSVLQRAGGPYLSLYNSNQALSCDQLYQLYQLLGMEVITDFKPTIEGWRSIMAGGPILTTLSNHNDEGHVVFLNRLYENTEQNEAFFGYFNPSSSNQEYLKVDEFQNYYGNPGAYCAVQFAYWSNESLKEMFEIFITNGEQTNMGATIPAPTNVTVSQPD